MSKVKNTTQKGKNQGEDIQIRQFREEDLPLVYKLIQETIDFSYVGVYPEEAIELFRNGHNQTNILNDAAAGYTVVAKHNGEIAATGTLLGTNIRRAYVSPVYQGRGIGTLIVRKLERKASAARLNILDLEASLVSRRFWESQGYIVQKEDFIPVRNDKKLLYYKMVKTLHKS